MAVARTVNVTDLIDEQPISRLQVAIVVVCGLVALLDGLDTQSIGVAAPLIAKTLGLPMSSFGTIFSAALFGATIGALSFGPIADRVGRKVMLAFAAFLFGAFTLMTAQAGSYETLLAYRFIAGLGLGGATPCFITLTSEYMPRHLRATLVGVLWSCFPLGGMIGGFLNAWILHQFGWQMVFWVGGTLPFLVGALVLAMVPESVRFLMASEAPTARVAAILGRMFPGAAPEGTRFTAREEHLGGITARHLFTEGRAIATLLLWVPLFLGFGALAVAVLWAPTLMNMAGMPPATTSLAIACMGLGGFVGNGSAGRLLDRTGILAGPVPALLLGALALAAFGHFADNLVLVCILGALLNGLIGVGMTGAIVMAATIYPVAVRSTGVGWAMSAGRCGQVVAPLITGMTLGWGWTPLQMLGLIAVGPAIGAASFVVLYLHFNARTAGAGWRPETAKEA